ncbi:hypothetical protein MTAT_17060 [Moorella thermoacetica]|uniref:Type I restriction modification DNA specificity domain-containing protein n=1 Tax=Neomoorella thermoacetica TaxID=1525 RepID=A0AAC9MU51_NEOTH|nr:hypothetical protein [Moorella thermoacetica]AOQ23176.1 hypothetical protein Maut_00713 [Moorella thermoacetica]TYL12883.1 hypothetical protein MTAT_17060 [Moorella thermoacetica]
MGNINDLQVIKNSLVNVSNYQSLRLDSFFFRNMAFAKDFFDRNFRWTKLDYLIKDIYNGENLDTKWYAIDEDTSVVYLSVSQITEYGLENKNVHYLKDEILSLRVGKKKRKIRQIEKNSIIVTRSGTPGIAISSNHPSFDYNNYTYIPSGFVIVLNLREELGIRPELICFYFNLTPVRAYIVANSSGRCQRNISQEIIKNLPIPEELLEHQDEALRLYDEVEKKSIEFIDKIKMIKEDLNRLWSESTNLLLDKI